MSPQTPRKALLAVTLLIALPILPRGAEAHPRPRTRPQAARRVEAPASPWRGLLAFLGLASQTTPPSQPQAGCDIDPDGKCKLPAPPTP